MRWVACGGEVPLGKSRGRLLRMAICLWCSGVGSRIDGWRSWLWTLDDALSVSMPSMFSSKRATLEVPAMRKMLSACLEEPGQGDLSGPYPGRAGDLLPLIATTPPSGYACRASAIGCLEMKGPYWSAVAMKFTPISTACRTTSSDRCGSAGIAVDPRGGDPHCSETHPVAYEATADGEGLGVGDLERSFPSCDSETRI